MRGERGVKSAELPHWPRIRHLIEKIFHRQGKISFVLKKISVYGKSSLSTKCLIHEMSYLWYCYIWNVLYMKCPIYDIVYIKCLSMKCPNAITLFQVVLHGRSASNSFRKLPKSTLIFILWSQINKCFLLYNIKRLIILNFGNLQRWKLSVVLEPQLTLYW